MALIKLNKFNEFEITLNLKIETAVNFNKNFVKKK